MSAIATAAQMGILLYFALLNVFFALSLFIASRQLSSSLNRGEHVGLKDLLEREFYKPVSILVPAFNEENTIMASLHSYLNLRYPEYEVLLINDGSTDGTMKLLQETYSLYPIVALGQQFTQTELIKDVYRSKTHPHLLVIDKHNGGKADALNAGLTYAQFPLFCSVDADSLLDAEALLRVTRKFIEDDTLIATGGTIRALNSADTASGQITGLRAPESWLERFQVVEYVRAFLAGRTALSHFRMLLIISGAFGLFKRSTVVELGGYRTDTVGEDMELIVRLHRWARQQKKPYRISYSVDPICWTQVPDNLSQLRRQRNRWQRGLWETLWTHAYMFANPRYGRIGLVATPYFWIFEAISPLIEVGGYILMIYLLVTGQLSSPFVIMFLALALLCGLMVSMAAFGIEIFTQTRYPTLKDRFLLFAASILENFGYRQFLALERFIATFQVIAKRGQWGDMKRKVITD